MSSDLETVRKNIVAQGFTGLTDRAYLAIDLPLRIAPAICMLWVAVGTVLASPVILWLLVPFAAAGAIFRGHPFDVFYNHGLRHLTGGPPLPPYGIRRRFACAMATLLITAAAWSFQVGAPLAGYILGAAVVAAAAVNVTLGFCIPSFVLRLFFGEVDPRGTRPRPRSPTRSAALG